MKYLLSLLFIPLFSFAQNGSAVKAPISKNSVNAIENSNAVDVVTNFYISEDSLCRKERFKFSIKGDSVLIYHIDEMPQKTTAYTVKLTEKQIEGNGAYSEIYTYYRRPTAHDYLCKIAFFIYSIKVDYNKEGEILSLTERNEIPYFYQSHPEGHLPIILIKRYLTNSGYAEYLKHNLEGKSFDVQIGNGSCKEFAGGGGCMTYEHRLIEFSKDSAAVFYYVKTSCSTPEKGHYYGNTLDRNRNKKQYTYTIGADGNAIIEDPEKLSVQMYRGKLVMFNRH